MRTLLALVVSLPLLASPAEAGPMKEFMAHLGYLTTSVQNCQMFTVKETSYKACFLEGASPELRITRGQEMILDAGANGTLDEFRISDFVYTPQNTAPAHFARLQQAYEKLIRDLVPISAQEVRKKEELLLRSPFLKEFSP